MRDKITALQRQFSEGIDPDDLRFNKNLLLGYFLYTTFNGALRKWVFSGSSAVEGALLVLQILSPCLLTFFMRRKKGALFYFPMLPLCLVLIAMALNPLNHTIYHGIFGFLLHIGFWICMIIYVQERESFPVEKLLPALIIVCLVECVLGFLQFGLPASHFLNRYVTSNNDVAGFDGGLGTRVTGTFSYITGYGAFLMFVGMLVWALLVEGTRPFWVILSLMAVGLVASFMNGGRSVVLPFLITLTFGFLAYGSMGDKIKAIVVAVFLGVIGLVYNLGDRLSVVEQAYAAFYGRVKYGNESGEASNRVTKTLLAVGDYNGRNPIFGAGLGATYQGAIAKWGRSPEVSAYFEEEPERVIMEGGYLLFIIRVLLFAYICKQLRIPAYFSIPLVLYVFIFSTLIFSTNHSIYTFLGLMVVDKMYFLREKKRAATDG